MEAGAPRPAAGVNAGKQKTAGESRPAARQAQREPGGEGSLRGPGGAGDDGNAAAGVCEKPPPHFGPEPAPSNAGVPQLGTLRARGRGNPAPRA